MGPAAADALTKITWAMVFTTPVRSRTFGWSCWTYRTSRERWCPRRATFFPEEGQRGRDFDHQRGGKRLSPFLHELVARVRELDAERQRAKLLVLFFPSPVEERHLQDAQLLGGSTLGPGERSEEEVEAQGLENGVLGTVIGLGDAMFRESLQELRNGRIIDVQPKERAYIVKSDGRHLLVLLASNAFGRGYGNAASSDSAFDRPFFRNPRIPRFATCSRLGCMMPPLLNVEGDPT
jgi:hypothetical protein